MPFPRPKPRSRVVRHLSSKEIFNLTHLIFTNLPRELRDMIYAYVFEEAQYTTHDASSEARRSRDWVSTYSHKYPALDTAIAFTPFVTEAVIFLHSIGTLYYNPSPVNYAYLNLKQFMKRDLFGVGVVSADIEIGALEVTLTCTKKGVVRADEDMAFLKTLKLRHDFHLRLNVERERGSARPGGATSRARNDKVFGLRDQMKVWCIERGFKFSGVIT